MLILKAGVLAAGARKRGHIERATYYDSKQAEYGGFSVPGAG